MRPSFALAIAASFLTSSVLAATHTWHGAVDYRFSTAANWIGGSPAGDPDADLQFVGNAVRTTVVNDIPNLPFHSMSFGATGYTVMGEPLAADDSNISGGAAAIYCDVTVAKHLTLGGVVMYGAISGPGEVAVFTDTTFAGSRPNTYTGETAVGSRLVLAKTNGAIAVAGNIRSFDGFDNNIRVAVNAPEQIADSATVDLSAGPADLVLNADETVQSLSVGTYVFADTSLKPVPTLTVGSLNVTGHLNFQANLHITGPDVQVPEGTSLSGSQKLTIPESGVTLHGGGSVSWQAGPTTYSAPVRIDGPLMQINNLNSPVELIAGKFYGSARSITATGGTIEYIAKSASDIRANASTQFEYLQTFDGGFTPITLNGTLDLGNASLFLDPAPKRLRGTSFLIQNTSSQPVIGTFNGLPEGAIVSNHWRISYHGGDGNDVTVTDLVHPQPTITFSQNPAPGIIGQPVTITATLSGAGGVPTGTLTFIPEGGSPVDVPITNGTATLQATYDAPVSGLRTSYSGDSTYASTTGFFDLQVKYPKPVVTSVTPPEVAAGSRVLLVIRGTGFFPQSVFASSSAGPPALPTTFVSPTELHALLDVSFVRAPTSLFFRVYSPGAESDLVRINVRAASTASPVIQFDSTSASATLTTGAKSAWISSDAAQTTTFIRDDDFDGVVRWTWDHLPNAAFTVVDMNNGKFTTKANGAATTTPAPIPAHTFVYDPSGFLTRIILPVTGSNPSTTWTVLWVRPVYVFGGGAWTTTITGTTLLTGSTEAMQPLGDSLRHPDYFFEGDIVVFMPRGASGQNIPVFASILGSDIDDEAPGLLQLAYANFTAKEADKKALIPVARYNANATTVSVHYRTIPRTALPGIQYSDVTGVLTLAPGESTKNIEVPLVDDAVYNPGSFDVQLFDPSGTSLIEPTEARVDITDDDPRPVVSLVGPATRTILRNPQLTTIPLEFELTGATALPVTVNWNDGSGQRSFVFAPGEHHKSILVPIPPPASQFAVAVLSISLTATGGASLVPDQITISLVPATLVHVRANGVTVSETGGSAKVTVSYVPPVPPNQFLILNYQTANGSATAGSDYTAAHGSITLTTAQPQQTIEIPITDDATVEGDESFTLSLTKDFTNDSFLEQSNVPIVISDDEVTTRPALSIAGAASVAETDVVTNAQIEVRLSAASTLPVRVRYATADGSATGGVDYQSFNDVLTFAPGETVKTISIPIFGDDLIEASKTFTITLSLPENATIGAAQSTVTIIDDDQVIPRRRAR